MADEEQVKLLKSGVEPWNSWRRRNPDARIDLCGAAFEGADLGEALLGGADLSMANLRWATVYSYYKSNFPATNKLVLYAAALQVPSITRRPGVATIVRVYGYMFVPGAPPDIKELHQGQSAGFLRSAPANKAHDVVLGTFILLSKFGTYGESIVRFSNFQAIDVLGAGADRELKEDKTSAVETALAEADATAEAVDFTPGG